MKLVIANILIIICLPMKTIATEISETNSILEGEINFYTQSNAGNLITCAIEFNGIDKDLNYFNGSYGFSYLENVGPVPLYKIKSLRVSLDGSKQINTISTAWIQSDSYSTVEENWNGGISGDSFLLVGTIENVVLGAKIYAEIVNGGVAKVGFLHKGDSIDRVYRLKAFNKQQEGEALACLRQMINQSIDKIDTN